MLLAVAGENSKSSSDEFGANYGAKKLTQDPFNESSMDNQSAGDQERKKTEWAVSVTNAQEEQTPEKVLTGLFKGPSQTGATDDFAVKPKVLARKQPVEESKAEQRPVPLAKMISPWLSEDSSNDSDVFAQLIAKRMVDKPSVSVPQTGEVPGGKSTQEQSQSVSKDRIDAPEFSFTERRESQPGTSNGLSTEPIDDRQRNAPLQDKKPEGRRRFQKEERQLFNFKH
jgi:hypothetical protein